MTDYNPMDILNYSINQQPLKVADAFDSIVRTKINDILPDYQDALTQSMFNGTDEDDDLDLDDTDYDDLDLDDGDFDIDEDDLDLEDLDLDIEDDA